MTTATMSKTSKTSTSKKAASKKAERNATSESIAAVRNWRDADGYGRQTEHYVRVTFGAHEWISPKATGAEKSKATKAHPGMPLVFNAEANKEEALLCALCSYRPWNSLHRVEK